MVIHSSVIAWEIPRTEELGGQATVHGIARSWTQFSHWPQLTFITAYQGFLFSLNLESEVKWKTLSCVWLCNPMDCSLLGSSGHGILQARIVEWVTFPFSRGSSQPRDRTQVSQIAGGFFTIWATMKAHNLQKKKKRKNQTTVHLKHRNVCTPKFGAVAIQQTSINHTSHRLPCHGMHSFLKPLGPLMVLALILKKAWFI